MDRMPVLFIAHGAPDVLLRADPVLADWRAVTASLPRPARILVISAHWDAPRHRVSGNRDRETLHDFAGFPAALYDYRYAPPADVAWAERLAHRLGLEARHERGLDHGAWVPLLAVYPAADIPVSLLSVASRLGSEAHLALGRQLAPLREEGVLILASGGIVHNLRRLDWRQPFGAPEPWAVAFLQAVEARLRQGDRASLAEPTRLPGGRWAVPTAEHYLPLLVACGAAGDEPVQPFAAQWRYRNLSQHGYRFG